MLESKGTKDKGGGGAAKKLVIMDTPEPVPAKSGGCC